MGTIEKIESFLEKQNNIWVPILGAALIIVGFYVFFDMKIQEEAGIPVKMKRAYQYLYDFGGKYLILALFESLGIFALISGIQQLRNRI
ncbi:hypothetical protein [Psychromonas sp. Urea-02u-13]|uniref:hypothetical protein n=1 Tax=Psychromonas sp. Urea-02u-13 TaxID=2058326 RepID=UPI000C34388F|nr:hypothetical protein [Psychromonas sp. Urea-02u-13]PKG38866.1 hypothetical protein CXF74_11285 [Psychromonas sp. Urea-02u-13]